MTRINRCFYLFTISFLFTFPLEAGARNIFAAKKIFTSDKTIDLIAWKVDGTTIFLDSTIGSAQNIGSFRLSSFLIRPYSPGKNDRDDYLYWAFLNLTSNSKSEDLSTRILEQQTFFDSLPRPLLALKQKGDSCQYLVLYRITYAPLAAGKVACPDLEKGIQEVDKELLGFQLLTAKDSHNPVHNKIIRRGEVSLDIPNAIDFGIESSAALSFGLSSDKDADQNNPFSQPVEKFDFKDFAEQESFPLAIRTFLTYRSVIGLRISYAYSKFAVNDKILASFNADTAAHGQILHEWKIKRNDYTWEVTIGRPFIGLKDEIYLYGFLGGAKIDFSETAKISGVSHKLSGTLTDVNAYLLGGGMDIKLAKHVLIGLDLGFMIKDFLFANSISQPDGSGNEFQLRIRFGGFQRFELGKP